MKKIVLTSALALCVSCLAVTPALSAGKKQMTTKQAICLILPGGVVLAAIAAANKKPAPCILNMMHERK